MTDFLQAHPQGTILAMDQITLYFQATLTRVWARIGQTPIIKVAPQRDHMFFYGVLDVGRGRAIAVPSALQNQEVTAHFLRQVLFHFPLEPILLLLDRAPWHFGPDIRAVLEANPHLELMYFPPACPDLNPQEHVWELARDAISHNHTYTDFGLLLEDFETFLNETPFDIKFLEKYVPAILCEV